MHTLSDIRNGFSDLHRMTKNTISSKNFQAQWNDLFGTSISPKDTEYFLRYYREMKKTRVNARRNGRRSNRKTYKGGKRRMNRKSSRRVALRSTASRKGGSYAMTGAPLNYSMVPGTTAEVYGRFPTDISTDPQSIQNLDQFYASALTRGCGVENITRQVPVNMGSNAVAKVGGKRKSLKGRKQRGGNLLETLGMRFYYPSPVPGPIQTSSDSMAGALPYPSSDATIPNWNYSDYKGIVMSPSMITSVQPNFVKLASPSPYAAGSNN